MTPVMHGSDAPCGVCHTVHRDLPRVLGAKAPDAWLAVTESERFEAETTPDICILPDGGQIRNFVRGHIQLPVADEGEPFVWSAWVEIDAVSMSALACCWSDPNRAAMAPIVGELATELPYEQPTRGLIVHVYNRDPGMAPLFMVSEGSGHRLAIEQRHGIELHRVAEFVAMVPR